MLHHIEYSWEDAVRDSLFYVVSMITTTGQITTDFMMWPPFVFTLLWIVMLLGASSGSTSGGIKIARIILLVKNSYYEFKRQIHPNAVIPVRYNDQIVQPQIINNVLAFPGIFRGALDCRATDINEEMKMAAAKAIASLVSDEELKPEYIIPTPFDKRVGPTVAKAVKEAAIATGVNRL
jgi:hypothetical protein